MTSKQVDLTKNFFALGPDVLAVRARAWTRRCAGSTRSSAPGRSSPRPTSGPSRPATPSARRPRSSTRTTASRRRSSPPGTYRNITGNEATALGFLAASKLAERDAVLRLVPDHAGVGHPPPAVGVQELRRQDVPGRGRDRGHRRGDRRDLRRRAGPDRHVRARASRSRARRMGLAVMVELPLVVVDVQRAGPSTGMPTKTEQADLLQVHVRAQRRLADAGRRAGDARRVLRLRHRGVRGIALKYMTPVVYLSDAFLANGAEPWKIPDLADLPDIVGRRTRPSATGRSSPYARDPDDARPAVGRARARRASSTASAASRRPTSPATSATTRRTTTGCSCCAPAEGRRHRRRHPAARGLRAADAATCSILGWGSTYGAIRERGRAAPGRRASRSPTPTCATSTRSRANTGDGPAQLPPRADPGDQPRPAVDAAPGEVPRSTPSATTGSAASRSASRRSIDEAERILGEGADTHDRRHGADDDTLSRAEPGAGIRADPEGLRVRPGGPLVPGLRRLLDPRPDPEGDARLRRARRRTSSSSPASAAPAGCRTT